MFACGEACSSSMSECGLIDSVRAVLAYKAATFVRHAVTCLFTLAMHHSLFVCFLRRKEEKFSKGGGEGGHH